MTHIHVIGNVTHQNVYRREMVRSRCCVLLLKQFTYSILQKLLEKILP
ncbi:unnamed protein product [Acanthoscelides obtectus]|uniref:Uncharacterized protein n=1 Tax=Acanthoscelides obtectus TaxID=200917 RepID=A0A9P0JX88_ACAOB|nr:unnamed protein product [Acanthoscelides obtectus]CAK1647019.1 hypothetical protein AOBTE_LOCUS15004 [Acanthoscelides obtectus]